jgi:hypothetical protein
MCYFMTSFINKGVNFNRNYCNLFIIYLVVNNSLLVCFAFFNRIVIIAIKVINAIYIIVLLMNIFYSLLTHKIVKTDSKINFAIKYYFVSKIINFYFKIISITHNVCLKYYYQINFYLISFLKTIKCFYLLKYIVFNYNLYLL